MEKSLVGPSFPLTKRQKEVFSLIKDRLTNKQIAAKLIVSERTVETHVKDILQKFGFRNRTELILLAGIEED